MTATPLIKDQSVVAHPPSGGLRADATAVGDAIFAEIFAAIDMTGLHGPDHAGDGPAGLSLMPGADDEKPASGDPVTGDVALFAKMMHRAKAALVVPDADDLSDIPQTADLAMLGGAEGHLSVLRLIGDLGATDLPVDLDKVVAYLSRLLNGESGATSEAVPLEAGVPPESASDMLALSDVELALMQVDGRLAIRVAGALERVSDDIAAYANIIGLAASTPQQATGQATPLVPAEGALLANASASPAPAASMTTSQPKGQPLIASGQAGSASVHAAVSLEAPSVLIATPDGPGAVGDQKSDTPVAKSVDNLTVRPDAPSAVNVFANPVARIADFVAGAEVAGPNGDALRDGATFQPASPDAGSKAAGALVSLLGVQAAPAEQGAFQMAPGVPTADSDLMYPNITQPYVVSAVSPMIAANMKTGRMLSSEQADGQQSDQRAGLVPQTIMAGSEILGARAADTALATITRIARGDAPAQAENNQKPAPDHRATGQAVSDMAGTPAAQSGTPSPAGSSSAASPVPMAQSGGLPTVLDVRRQGWTQTLVQRAAGMVQSGGVLTLKILPQHLGQITLKMSEGRRGLDLRIVTEVASTAAMLRGVEGQISSAFDGAGLTLGEFSANTGKGGDTPFDDDGDDSDPALAGLSDSDETDARMISDDTAQHSLLNIIL